MNKDSIINCKKIDNSISKSSWRNIEDFFKLSFRHRPGHSLWRKGSMGWESPETGVKNESGS